MLGDQEMAHAGHHGRVADGKPAGPLQPHARRDQLVVLAEPQAHGAPDLFGREPHGSGIGRSSSTTSWLPAPARSAPDRKSTRLNSSHVRISYAVFCLKK